jgi:hypothetical protein
MSIEFNYRLGTAGWAEATISDEHQSCTMTASYLHDSLGELTMSANLLMQGVNEAKVLFMDEPGEHMMLLCVEKENILDVEIRWFEDWASWDLVTSKEYKVVFKAKSKILDFANELLKNLEKIYSENGIAGYKEKWILNDFPTKSFEKLKELLRSEN